ncbi:MAG: aminotransferase class III [Cryomorphaceae bacterium]|nr:aminotransferase class III [Cryomorphaceae bacterium]
MKEAILKAFGILPLNIKRLNGYENENYLVTAKDAQYIFKTYPSIKNIFSLINAECLALIHLQQKGGCKTPIPIPFISGEYVKTIHINNQEKCCRMLSFLPGSFLGDIKPNKSLMANLGAFLADLNQKLDGFHSDAIRARNYDWDLQNLTLNRKHISAIPDPKQRRIVAYFFQKFDLLVSPYVPELRKSYIHSDFNEWNVLAEGDQALGLIDFGDIVYSPLINEVATALCYLSYDKDTFFDWTTPFLKAYHKIIPLKKKEIGLLYYLIATKLCISVCQSAKARLLQPENKYASVSENNAWKMLHKLLILNPISVENHFMQALGLSKEKTVVLAEKVKTRERYFSRILSISYKRPIYMTGAAFQYMYDGYGNTFLDAYNNIPHVGHSHPKVVAAGQQQMATLNTNTRYLYDLLSEYAALLLQKLPKKLNKVFFVNSGSEANDLAIRMAQKHSGKQTVMVLEHGYHGHTQTGIDISEYKFNHPKGQGQKSHILKTAIPKEYKGKYEDKDAPGALYAKEAIEQLNRNENGLAAFIAEPIVGCGGQVPLASGYLKALYPEIRKKGGLCISDEVQTGFGRLGSVFWGYELQGVVPDMVVIGKPMGNGHPMGAVVTSEEVAASFAEGVEFFSSFGGNPVSCAIGKAVLEIIDEEKLQKNAFEVGKYYCSLLRELQKEDARIGDVRGEGLFLGVELINDQEKPNTNLAQFLKNELRNRQVLISTDGPADSVIKTKPPIIFTKSNAERVVSELRRALKLADKKRFLSD